MLKHKTKWRLIKCWSTTQRMLQTFLKKWQSSWFCFFIKIKNNSLYKYLLPLWNSSLSYSFGLRIIIFCLLFFSPTQSSSERASWGVDGRDLLWPLLSSFLSCRKSRISPGKRWNFSWNSASTAACSWRVVCTCKSLELSPWLLKAKNLTLPPRVLDVTGVSSHSAPAKGFYPLDIFFFTLQPQILI